MVTTKSIAERYNAPGGLFIQDMPMIKISTLDLGYEGYSYLPDGIDSNDQVVLLMASNSADTSVQSVSLALT